MKMEIDSSRSQTLVTIVKAWSSTNLSAVVTNALNHVIKMQTQLI